VRHECDRSKRRGAGVEEESGTVKEIMVTALDRVPAEVKRPTVILAFSLLLTCAGAWAQNDSPLPGLPQNLRPTRVRSAQEQRQELRTPQNSLPDAPSAVLTMQRERFRAFPETSSPFIFDGAAIDASMARESAEHLAPGATPRFSASYGAPVSQKESNVFFDKYLCPSLQRQDPQYHPSTSDSFMGLASDAVSRLFITSDNSGKRKFNTSYLLVVLASAAVATNAYRPYRTQSVSGTFGNFGSTVGGDVGKNIFRQLWPRVHQILRGHSLKVLQ
jgi:hypothetical protein